MPMLKAERISCSGPKLSDAQTRNFEAIKYSLRPIGNVAPLESMVGDVTEQVAPPTMLVRAAGRQLLMFTKNWSEGTAVENLDQRSSRRPSHGIQRGAEKERPRDIHQVRP